MQLDKILVQGQNSTGNEGMIQSSTLMTPQSLPLYSGVYPERPTHIHCRRVIQWREFDDLHTKELVRQSTSPILSL